jgi:hypothetical protein
MSDDPHEDASTLPALYTPQPENTADAKTGSRRPKLSDMPAFMEAICEGLSLRAACRKFGLHPPSTHTFIDQSDDLREQYARAREQRSDGLTEDVLTIARAAALGRKVDGRDIDAGGARVYIEAVKWVVGRMAPKSNPATRFIHSFVDVSDEEIDARLRAALAMTPADEPIDAEFE